MDEGRRDGCFKKVMVAIDESKYSHHALIWTLDNLKELIMTGSPLIIFAAQPNPSCFDTYGAQFGSARAISSPFPATRSMLRRVLDQNQEVTLRLLEKAASICDSRGVKADTMTEAGEPQEVICKAVEDGNVDLLVLADQPIGNLKRAFQGSCSDYCSKYAKCHVLIVKKPE